MKRATWKKSKTRKNKHKHTAKTTNSHAHLHRVLHGHHDGRPLVGQTSSVGLRPGADRLEEAGRCILLALPRGQGRLSGHWGRGQRGRVKSIVPGAAALARLYWGGAEGVRRGGEVMRLLWWGGKKGGCFGEKGNGRGSCYALVTSASCALKCDQTQLVVQEGSYYLTLSIPSTYVCMYMFGANHSFAVARN